MRSTSRIMGVSINTVIKLLLDAGEACAHFHDQYVRDLSCRRIECDEIWSFCYAKRKNAETAQYGQAGDVWSWTAIDVDTKLLVSLVVGNRDTRTAATFMRDVESRLAHRVQISTDGLKSYIEAVQYAFGDDVDFGQLVKQYGERGRYTGAERRTLIGQPIGITTAHVERHNLTMRMSMRRFTRKTNGFSKKFENHCAMQALYQTWYNFVRPHKSLDGRTPAMDAGLAEYRYGEDWIVEIIDAYNATPKSN